MKFGKILILIAVAGVLTAGGWGAYYLNLPVAVVGKVTLGTAVKVVPANILVTESFTQEIKGEVGGRILKSNVQRGQPVTAGDILYQIDTRDFELETELIEANYKALKERIAIGSSIRFEIATAEENLRNSTRLAEQGRIAAVELERAKRSLEGIKDRLANENINNQLDLDKYENTLKARQRTTEKMSIQAHKDGTISEFYAQDGALVGGGAILALVISKERLVQAQISEENFSGVLPGLSATVQLLGYGDQSFTAKVERVLPNSDERTKRYIAYLKVDIAEEKLVPGLTGEANITVDTHENVLRLDTRGLIGRSVFVVREGRVKLVPVSLGFSGMDFTEVLGGLAEGDEIILERPAQFRDGQRVRSSSGN